MANELQPAEQDLVKSTRNIVFERLSAQGAGHGMEHVERVWGLAKRIQASEGGQLLSIELGALLHDVGDAKFHQGQERSGEFAREILGNLQARQDVIESVVQIVDSISFRKDLPASKLTLEAKIVQDADRIDALGAIGIVRAIEFGASRGQPFFLPGDESEATCSHRSTISHFYKKLFKLRKRLNTPFAKAMTHQREKFMNSFLAQYFSEYE